MRNSRTCPKCQSRKLWVVERSEQPDKRSMNGTHPLTVTAAWVPNGKSGFFEMGSERMVAGTFEVWVCTQCGFTEWYAKDANQVLAYLSNHPDAKVHYIDGDASKPYR